MQIRFSARTFCKFYSSSRQIIDCAIYEPVFGEEFIDPQTGDWVLARESEVIDILMKIPFFRRYSRSILRKFLPYFRHRKVFKDEVLFPQKEVIFMIGGTVIIYDHSKDFETPQIVSYYVGGDLIGCEALENNISKIPDYWCICQTSQVEFIQMDKAIFPDFWKAQYTLDREQRCWNLRSLQIFKNVSDLTVYKLAYELMEEVNFRKGDIIYNDLSYIPEYNIRYIQMKKNFRDSDTLYYPKINLQEAKRTFYRKVPR